MANCKDTSKGFGIPGSQPEKPNEKCHFQMFRAVNGVKHLAEGTDEFKSKNFAKLTVGDMAIR
jgi:hypothetical protein